jgi:hypothetical protein
MSADEIACNVVGMLILSLVMAVAGFATAFIVAKIEGQDEF